MSLEERLLIEAKSKPELVKQAIQLILDRGTSSFTTSVVASLMMAHPSLVTEKMLGIFKCSWFFVDDFSRCQSEPEVLAIHGGHDGLDSERQKERIASKNLPHRRHTLVILASRSPSLPNMPTALANIVTEPVWKVRRAAANAISDVLRARQPELAAVLTWGLAHYAETLETMISQPRGRMPDQVESARDASVKALLGALANGKPGEIPVPTSLVAAKEWTIALDAAKTESPGIWRVRALSALVRLIADQEGKPRVDHHDPDHVDFDARWETGDLLASELLAQSSGQDPAFELLAYCLEHATELSERVLESTLLASMKHEYVNAEAFWRVWDEAIAIVLADPSIRTRSRRSYSRLDKVLRTLLFCSVPWLNTRYDLPLLQHRPDFIAHCLTVTGGSRPALKYLLRLMAGIGQTQAVPAAVPQLRDAIRSAPADLFDDGDCLWNAETICRVAVHEHRLALMRDVTLRRATLDVLDRLVDAGSSLAFQLRDYLASSATTSSPTIN